MEPVQVLASGLTLEESKTKRLEKQAARYRHRLGCVSRSLAFGALSQYILLRLSDTLYLPLSSLSFSTYVPSGDSKGLLEALMATSSRKSPTPRRTVFSRSTNPRKSVKSSVKGNSSNEIGGGFTQETEPRTNPRKSTSRKPIKIAGSGVKEVNRGASSAATHRYLRVLIPDGQPKVKMRTILWGPRVRRGRTPLK
jgi:hypothetical protein